MRNQEKKIQVNKSIKVFPRKLHEGVRNQEF
jgi:hypothetical protein